MIKAGKTYKDMSGTKLSPMNVSEGIGDFWCASLGDGRYYNANGKCIALFGRANGGENRSPGPEKNIGFEG